MIIGILMPYSGEFPELKQAILKPIKSFALANGHIIVQEFIGSGDFKTVEKAVHKLCYHDDVDVVIGYVGYRVMVRLFDTINRYQDKVFVHLTLGEIIPYSYHQLIPPTNYQMISFEAYKQQSALGSWISEKLAPESCLMCSSLYDAGYSFMNAFQIGYKSTGTSRINFTVLKNQPDVLDVKPLYEDIERTKPAHLHIVLCGRELKRFIEQFSENVSYSPSVSFAFPLDTMSLATKHSSFEKIYTVVPEFMSDLSFDAPFQTIFNHLSKTSTKCLEKQGQSDSDQYMITTQNLHTGEIDHHGVVGTPKNIADQFEYAAAQMVSGWENPYLCI